MFKSLLHLSVVVLLLVTGNSLQAQISYGGLPYSFEHTLENAPEEIHLTPIDAQKFLNEDLERDRRGEFYRTGIAIPVEMNSEIQGTWESLPNGDRLWRLTLGSRGAVALGVYFTNLWIPEGGELYLYNADKTKILGAYTYLNNAASGIFSTEPIPGDLISIEYYEPSYAKGETQLEIGNIAYMYRGFDSNGLSLKNYNTSGTCQVDVACSEANAWRDQERSVAKIVVKDGTMYGFCTGSLVNNTEENCMPYFLTADHCGETSSFEDFQAWVFIFNYQRSECNNTSEGEPGYTSVVGAQRLAHGINNVGSRSDFLLVQLSTYLPGDVEAYFNAWRNTNLASSAGVGIHHPSGDIKKISTYTSTISNYYNTHWNVGWATTVNGWGVTEGGSSGSPLFNSAKEVIGTLTGGLSACENGGAGAGTGPYQKDIYGKFSYHWASNGTAPTARLKDWLDPGNSGATSIAGLENDCELYPVVADFFIEDTIIPLNTTLKFFNTSLYHPDLGCSYFWEFEGTAQTATSVINSPTRTFIDNGVYPVKLTATSDGISSQKIIHLYVGNLGVDQEQDAGFVVYPNPAREEVFVNLSDALANSSRIELSDLTGRTILSQVVSSNNSTQRLNVSDLPSGIYQVIIYHETGRFSKKLSLVK